MLRAVFLFLLAGVTFGASPEPDPGLVLHLERSAPGDLEVGGELAGAAKGSTRYLRYEDLLQLPQETYTVSDDTNFSGKTEISGVPLTELAKRLGNRQDDLLIVAICYDKYRTNYPRDYLSVHHPLLVMRINRQPREHWPQSEYGGPLGPYLISHAFFKPAFTVLSHEDEPQIPFGVVRLEFRRESEVFGAIKPGARWIEDKQVQQGFVIARQDCFRCHNMGAEGGTMAGRSWLKLAEDADADGRLFRQTIHNPVSIRKDAKMPAHGDYDDATLDALTAYFRTFVVNKGAK